jgi:hypothetical protein
LCEWRSLPNKPRYRINHHFYIELKQILEAKSNLLSASEGYIFPRAVSSWCFKNNVECSIGAVSEEWRGSLTCRSERSHELTGLWSLWLVFQVGKEPLVALHWNLHVTHLVLQLANLARIFVQLSTNVFITKRQLRGDRQAWLQWQSELTA